MDQVLERIQRLWRLLKFPLIWACCWIYGYLWINCYDFLWQRPLTSGPHEQNPCWRKATQEDCRGHEIEVGVDPVVQVVSSCEFSWDLSISGLHRQYQGVCIKPQLWVVRCWKMAFLPWLVDSQYLSPYPKWTEMEQSRWSLSNHPIFDLRLQIFDIFFFFSKVHSSFESSHFFHVFNQKPFLPRSDPWEAGGWEITVTWSELFWKKWEHWW